MKEISEKEIQFLELRVKEDSQTPLFARLAEVYLLRGKIQEALEICERGLSLHPFYTTAHIVKGKVLTALSMISEAKREYEFAQRFLPGNPIVLRLIKELPQVETAPPTKGVGARTVAPKTVKPSVKEQPSAQAEEIIPTPPKIPVPPAPEVISPIVEVPEDYDFGKKPIYTPPEEKIEEPVPADTFDFSGMGGSSFRIGEEVPPAQVESPKTAEAEVFGDPFGFLHGEPPSGASETPIEIKTPEQVIPKEDVWSFDSAFGAPSAAPTEEPKVIEESFEEFVARIMPEMRGTENTTTLDDYIGKTKPPTPPPPKAASQIETLAEKLEQAKRITPIINLADKSIHRGAAEDESTSTMGFVTPTLAEIYAKQGWFDDAIRAYKTLAKNRPADREKFEKRIAELEAAKAAKG
jgi:tetratricopeptide (TPR) repeat protein